MLSKRQKEVARALYEGRHSEAELAERFQLGRNTLAQWLEQPDFQQELQRLCQSSLRETRFIITRYGPIAALRLAELLGAEKDDTARRAALDMVDRCLKIVEPGGDSDRDGGGDRDDPFEQGISDEQARTMLLALAEAWKS